MRPTREIIRKGALLHSAPAPGHCAVVADRAAVVRSTREPAPSFEEIRACLDDIYRRLAAMRKARG